MQTPFDAPSTLPYGMPPFADIRDEHYEPAFERGMAEQLAEIRAITERRDMPTFENTMIPLERSGQLLERVATVFFNKVSADGDDFTSELEERIAPRLAAHADAIKLDSTLYRRIESLYHQLDGLGLDAEARYLVERHFMEFTIAGAGLDDDEKEQLQGSQPAAVHARDPVREEPARRHQRPRRRDRRRRRPGGSRAGRDLRRRRGGEGSGSCGQAPRHARAADRASVARLARQARGARTHHGGLPGARQPRKPVGQQRARAADREAACRARAAARVRVARPLGHRG